MYNAAVRRKVPLIYMVFGFITLGLGIYMAVTSFMAAKDDPEASMTGTYITLIIFAFFAFYFLKQSFTFESFVDKQITAHFAVHKVAKQRIETLSKGYKRRVGFAVSILGNPPILLLDEPTDGLDPNQKEHMLGLIKDMSKDKTIIISTHLLDEAQSIANRIMIMNKGKVKIDGDLDAITKQTRTTSLENAFIKLTR
jgi:ABC-type multidrug transport system ATPase subunit